MISVRHPAVVAICVAAALGAAQARAAAAAAPSRAAAASMTAAANASRDPDSSAVAHPGVLLLATLATIGFVTRRLRV